MYEKTTEAGLSCLFNAQLSLSFSTKLTNTSWYIEIYSEDSYTNAYKYLVSNNASNIISSWNYKSEISGTYNESSSNQTRILLSSSLNTEIQAAVASSMSRSEQRYGSSNFSYPTIRTKQNYRVAAKVSNEYGESWLYSNYISIQNY